MLGEKQQQQQQQQQTKTNKQKMWARVQMTQTSSLIGWIFFYWNCDWTRAWQAVMSNELSQRTIEQQQQQKTALSVYILPTALFENYSEKRF